MTKHERRSGTIYREISLDGDDIRKLFAAMNIDTDDVPVVSVSWVLNGAKGTTIQKLRLSGDRLILSFQMPAKEVR